MRTIECLKPAILACLLVLLLSPAILAQSSEDTAFSLKEGTVVLLEDAFSGHGRSDRRIEKAIGFIEDSLDPWLWADGNHLVKATGAEVFNAEKKAIRKLEKILDDAGAPTIAVDAATDAIAALLAADVLLAEIALDEAIASRAVADCDAGVPGGGGSGDSDSDSDSDSDTDSDIDPYATDCDCNRADRRIAKAEEQLALALAAIADGDFDAAVNAYKKAWKKACKGRLAVAECPVVEITCPCASDSLWVPFVDDSADVAGCTFDPDPDDYLLQAGTAFVRAEVIANDEGAFCSAFDADSGSSLELEILQPDALDLCIGILTAAITTDLGGLGACN